MLKRASRFLPLLCLAAIAGQCHVFAAPNFAPPTAATSGVLSGVSGEDLASARTRGTAMFYQEHFVEAVQQFRMVVSSGSSDAKDFYWLGQANLYAGKYTDAARAFQNAINVAPNEEKYYLLLVDAQLAAKDQNGAIQSCSAGLNVAKDSQVREQLQSMAKYAANCGISPYKLHGGKPARSHAG